jgi:hypothetical protein
MQAGFEAPLTAPSNQAFDLQPSELICKVRFLKNFIGIWKRERDDPSVRFSNSLLFFFIDLQRE